MENKPRFRCPRNYDEAYEYEGDMPEACQNWCPVLSGLNPPKEWQTTGEAKDTLGYANYKNVLLQVRGKRLFGVKLAHRGSINIPRCAIDAFLLWGQHRAGRSTGQPVPAFRGLADERRQKREQETRAEKELRRLQRIRDRMAYRLAEQAGALAQGQVNPDLEARNQVIALLKEGRLSQSEIARQVGVNRQVVNYWKNKLTREPEGPKEANIGTAQANAPDQKGE